MTDYTATLPAAPVTPQHLPQTSMDAWYGILRAFTEARGTYTASWTAASVNPAIGNGTIYSDYSQVGKLVRASGSILMGSTTTFGTGGWSVSLPVTGVAANLFVGVVYLEDNSLVANRRGGVVVMPTTSTISFYPFSAGIVGPTAPFTWAQSDKVEWSIIYEAA